MKRRIVLVIAVCLMTPATNAKLIDELQGRNGFLSNMGYPEEVVPMTDESLNYENFEHFETFTKNILLIINYNHQHYGNNEFLRTLYEPFFADIVFYGPENYNDVVGYNALNGVLGYVPIRLAMEKYPDYEGYLFLEDDCTINLWNCVRFDKEKIWLPDINSRRIFNFGERARWSHWNYNIWGDARVQSAFKELPKKYRSMIKKNIGKNKAMGGAADIVYFPAKFREDVIELCRLFQKENVFIEIAIPTIAACLDYQGNWESLHGKACPLQNYNPYFDYVHPTKFSRGKERSVVHELFISMWAYIDSLKIPSFDKINRSMFYH